MCSIRANNNLELASFKQLFQSASQSAQGGGERVRREHRHGLIPTPINCRPRTRHNSRFWAEEEEEKSEKRCQERVETGHKRLGTSATGQVHIGSNCALNTCASSRIETMVRPSEWEYACRTKGNAHRLDPSPTHTPARFQLRH